MRKLLTFGFIYLLLGCSVKKKLAAAVKSQEMQIVAAFEKDLLLAQKSREEALAKLVVTLPEYQGIKDLNVVLSESVARINQEYDEQVRAVLKEMASKKQVKLDSLGKRKKIFGIL